MSPHGIDLLDTSRRAFSAAIVAGLLAANACAAGDVTALDAEARAWNAPIPPFRIAGDLYYIGPAEVTSYAIVTPAGLIVIDTGFVQTVPQLVANLAQLGHRVEEIRYILASHAHYDHVGGIAELKRLSGATVVASEGNAQLMARGGRGDPQFGDRIPYPRVGVDRIIADGESVELGGVRVTARLTPGHMRGCTTWMVKERVGDDLRTATIACSVTAPGYKLVANAAYPRVVEDFRYSFDVLEHIECDIFLGNHGSTFGLTEKRARLAMGDASAFVDPGGCRRLAASSRKALEKQLASQAKDSTR